MLLRICSYLFLNSCVKRLRGRPLQAYSLLFLFTKKGYTLANRNMSSILFVSTTSDYVLKALPSISLEYKEQAEKLTSTFTGDPSFFAFNGEEEDPAADEEVSCPNLIIFLSLSFPNIIFNMMIIINFTVNIIIIIIIIMLSSLSSSLSLSSS